MLFIKRSIASSIFSPVTLIGAQFVFNTQAHAWSHFNGEFQVCNKMNGAFQVKKTGSYQMNTRDHDSANQVINAHSCENIKFWAQWKSNSDDYDDAMDFDVIHNGETVGHFTIKVLARVNFAGRLYYGLRKGHSNFVKLISEGGSNAVDIQIGIIEFDD